MSDSTELKPFTPEQLQERITNTVRANFGMLVPDEQFNALVEKEINAFFDEKTVFEWEGKKVGYWNDAKLEQTTRVKMSPFRYQVWGEIRKQINDKISRVFMSPEFMAHITQGWNMNNNQTIDAVLSDMLNKKLEELAPKMAASMFQQMFVQAVDTAKMDIKNDLLSNGISV